MIKSNTIAEEYVFGPSDYKIMRFNVMRDKGLEVLELYPELARFASFQDIKKEFPSDCERIYKYICLCYDRMSPAYTQIPDIFKRKAWCGMAAGFLYNPDSSVFEQPYYNIMDCKVESVNLAIIDFSSMFNSPEYMLIVTAYESFYAKNRVLQSQVSMEGKDILAGEKIRGELYTQCRNINNDIRALTDIYLADRNPYLREDLYRVVQDDVRKRLMLTPERRAEWRKSQSDPDLPSLPKKGKK
jgi:hypothetical protein